MHTTSRSAPAFSNREAIDRLAFLWYSSEMDGRPETAAVFEETVLRLKSHYSARRLPPSRDATDPEEKRLGSKLNRYRVKEKKGLLAAERVALLDKEVPLWRETYNSNEFLPPRLRASVQTLGLDGARAEWKKIWYRANPEAKRIIEQHLGEFLTGDESLRLRAEKDAESLIAWVIQEGRMPTFSSPGNPSPDAEERRLAGAILRFRKNSTPATASVQSKLDASIPGWRDTRLTNMRVMANRVAELFEKTERFPLSESPEERPLYIWLSGIRRAHRTGLSNPEAVAILDARVPDWTKTRSRTLRAVPPSRTLDRAMAVAEVVVKTGKYPRSSQSRVLASGERTTQHRVETGMGLFLSNLRNRAYSFDDQRQAEEYLDKHAPLWRISRDYSGRQKPTLTGEDYLDGSLEELLSRAAHLWETDGRTLRGGGWGSILQNYVDHYHAHGDPRYDAEDASERSLYTWMNNQKAAFQKGRLSDERVSRLDEAFPRWRNRSRSHLGSWEQMLSRCSAYIQEHGAPTYNHESADVRRLYVWLHKQKSLAKAGKLSKERAAALGDSLTG